jgi:hypothetical protein
MTAGKFPLAEQANALIIQAFPSAPGIDPAQKIEPFRHRDVVPFRIPLHTDKIAFCARSVHKASGGTDCREKS